MNHLKAILIALTLFIVLILLILFISTKIVIPMKLDIGESIKTPNVVGLNLNDAKSKLTEAGFVISDSLAITWVSSPNYPDRTIISQLPQADKIVKNPNRIQLEVSSGGQQVVVPLVLEDNAINASSKIKQLGLEVDLVKKNYGLYEQNTVVEVEPKVGTRIDKGSHVILYIESDIVEADSLVTEIDSLILDLQSKEDMYHDKQ